MGKTTVGLLEMSRVVRRVFVTAELSVVMKDVRSVGKLVGRMGNCLAGMTVELKVAHWAESKERQ